MPEDITAPRPWVQVAVLCQTALIENTGHLSVIRIVDRINLAGVTPELQPTPVQLTMAILLKSDLMEGNYPVKIRCTSPQGVVTEGPELAFVFEGKDRGVQVVLPMGLIATEQGVYWFDVLIEGEITLTRVPLRVIYQRVQTLGQMPPGVGAPGMPPQEP
jgi:hypothetical protein